MYRDIPEDLRRLIEPVVVDRQCELVNVERVSGGASGLLRITIDSPSGDGRVPVERCAEVSREIETQLDAADAIQGQYKLEVSSPGLDRVLGREKDFVAACGAAVRVQTRRLLDGRRRFKGRLAAFEDGVARIEMQDATVAEVPFAEIEKANVVYEFTSADFAEAGASEPRRGRKGRREGREKQGNEGTGGS